jgi:hypothetical protein
MSGRKQSSRPVTETRTKSRFVKLKLSVNSTGTINFAVTSCERGMVQSVMKLKIQRRAEYDLKKSVILNIYKVSTCNKFL